MASTTAMIILAATITVMALISAPTVEAQTECVSKLVPCFSSLNTTTPPLKECCDSIKEAVEKELSCLCTIYTTPGLLAQFKVNSTQAINLSTRCGVQTNISACNGTGSQPPKASLPPPAGNKGGNKGGDAGAGNKLAGYGVTTVILSLVSSIFF